ncbi:MAG: Xaa-Pro dipeptidase [Gammaproteobacteria bacterium CG22_combo_CG10-13_8_21_14_all_40_8]|nr:MAG: Xaa-Pro dipeptidase [Gammaproteobacteria bacterium CG22_combo_CG10-13_8_21_14_all_40_8]
MPYTFFENHINSLRFRFDKAMKLNHIETLLIPSGEVKNQFMDDMDYPFKVNPHFKTWVPIIDTPHCWVVYKVGQKPLLVFSEPLDFWHKTTALPHETWTQFFDIVSIHSQLEAFEQLPDNDSECALIGEWHSSYQGRLDQLLQNPETLLNHLQFARTLKTDYEVACIQQANHIAAKGHITAEALFRSGHSELAIHLGYLESIGHMEHEVPYGNIVALNQNNAILHYQHASPKKLAQNTIKSFLIDAGANFNGYASDITRTYAYQQDEFSDLILAFDALQQDLVQQLKPGLDYKQLHLQAHLKIAALMKQFELLDMSPESALESGVSSTFLPHGLGHFIGLQVHDCAGKVDADGEPLTPLSDHPFLRLFHSLQPGHVITIEPGLYFIPSLLKALKNHSQQKAVNWSKIESFIPYGGIRIEDDVLITESGFNNLTRNAFSQARDAINP